VQETSRDQPASAANKPGPGQRPLLIYDGDCGFCVYWARYWQKLTGDRVDYRPYQEAGAQYPDIPQAEFQRAVQYIAPDGTRASAAEASFLTLSHAPRKRVWLWLYRHVPGFAPISEWAYAFTAAHRPAFFRVSQLLWGKDHEPPRYELVSSLFLRLLGLIYLSAFVSFAVQAQGLIGSHGIQPLTEFVNNVAARFGPELLEVLENPFEDVGVSLAGVDLHRVEPRLEADGNLDGRGGGHGAGWVVRKYRACRYAIAVCGG